MYDNYKLCLKCTMYDNYKLCLKCTYLHMKGNLQIYICRAY